MSKAMARQIEPDIQIDGASVVLAPSPGSVSSAFLVYCDFRAWFRNKNSAIGSVVEPDVFALLDDGTELKAGSTRHDYTILTVAGGGLQAANIRYQFLIHHSDPDCIDKTNRLLSSTTRFRISCMDNLGVDRGKGVHVTLINRAEDQPE